MTKAQKAEQERAITELRKIVQPGETVYTTVKHVSRSGMLRVIDVHVIQDNAPRWISRFTATAIGFAFDERREAIRVGGCGMDMGFHVVYELSHRLYPDGFGCIGEGNGHGTRCPSSDHNNGDRDYTPHDPGDIRWTEGSVYKGPHHHWHKSGGYALRHRWM